MSDGVGAEVQLQPCPFCDELFVVGSELIQHVTTHDDPIDQPGRAQRRGACFRCKQEGHWANECPQNPRRQERPEELKRLDIKDLTPSAILGAQRPAPCLKMDPPLIILLKHCLSTQNGLPLSYRALLSGYIDHYETLPQDTSWGCGYKNIQMQLSHAVYSRQNGQQFWGPTPGVSLDIVPDIPSLQAWIELAWVRGYDDAGASHFNGSLQGKKTWIGTPECGALFRFLGLQAHMIDFQTQRLAHGGNPNDGSQPANAGASAQEIHQGVQCDGCGTFPIVGERHKSEVLPDYDLCGSCHRDNLRAAGRGPFKRIKTQESSAEGAAKLGLKLAEWVWRYFDETPAAANGTAQLRPDQPVKLTGKPPLYFQHDGHSRTIVGIERRDKQGGSFDYTLLVLDPSTPTRSLYSALENKHRWQVLVKRGLHTMRKEEYQLLYIEKRPQTVEEYKRLSNTSGGVELKELITD